VKPRFLSIPVAVAVALTGGQSSAGSRPVLEGRAVLPVETLAPGPPSGAFAFPVPQVVGIYPLDGRRAIIGCDNNIPNTGRNPGIGDDSEFILVRIPGLKPHGRPHR